MTDRHKTNENQEAQFQNTLARIEITMDTFAVEQRQILKAVQELRSDLVERQYRSHVGSQDGSVNSGISTPGLQSEASFVIQSNQVGSAENEKLTDFNHLVMQASAQLKSSLSQRWPTTLTKRAALETLCAQNADGRGSVADLTTTLSRNTFPIQEQEIEKDPVRVYIILPASVLRSIIDMIATLSLVWDLVFAPLQLAWDLSIEGWLFLMAISIASFWTLDVLLSFLTAFYTASGDLETRPYHIAAHYVRRQFFLDLSLVVCDWINILSGLFPGGFQMMRALKITRLIRLTRVLRLFSRDAIERVRVLGIRLELIESIKIMAICIWSTHVISCAWFSIGNLDSSDTGLHWVGSSWAKTAPTFADAKPEYQYASALQWTLTTMVSGTSSILPLNSVEQFFSCTCILLGLLGQAFVISILSSTAVEENLRRRFLTTTLTKMNKFCGTHRVSAQLQQNARSQVIASIVRKANAGLSADQVDGLQLASRKVRMKILQEVFEPSLCHHSLFFLCMCNDQHTVSKLTSGVMTLSYVQIGHEVFMAGTSASRMYLLSKGKTTYMQDPESSKVSEKRTVEVLLHTWFCEAALWTDWVHVGTMEATSGECELHCLDVLEFIQIASTSTTLKKIIYDYAVQYHLRLIKSVPPVAPWPSDVFTSGASFAHILVSLSESTRKLIASLTFECAMNLELLLVKDHQMEVLSREIHEGKVNLIISGTPSSLHVHRVVSFARIYLTASDDRTLIELGKRHFDGSAVVTCDIPHETQRASEDILTTVHRIIDRLRPAIGNVTLSFTEVSEDFQQFTRSALFRSSRFEFPTYHLFYDAHYLSSTTRKIVDRQVTAGMFARGDSALSVASALTDGTGSNPLSKKKRKSSGQSSTSGTGRSFFSRRFESTTSDAIKAIFKNEKNVFALRRNDDNNSTVVYAWLSRSEVELLQSRKGIDYLDTLFQTEDWIPVVQEIPLDVVEEAVADSSDACNLEIPHDDGDATLAPEPVYEI